MSEFAFLAAASDGDARTALNVLEMAVTNAPPDAEGAHPVSLAAMQDAFARKALLYDKAGEEHCNIISALHKSIRNSDADAGLYWLARMLEAGEDPLYVARRLVGFASEDVAMADPQVALELLNNRLCCLRESLWRLVFPEGIEQSVYRPCGRPMGQVRLGPYTQRQGGAVSPPTREHDSSSRRLGSFGLPSSLDNLDRPVVCVGSLWCDSSQCSDASLP